MAVAGTLIHNAHVITVDEHRRELSSASVLIDGATITAVSTDPIDDLPAEVIHVDGSGCVLTPGLVNTHHHLYQWITRGLAADHTLFQWLTTLYPIWAGIDETAVHTAALGGIGQLVMSGCTTTTDHHYVFPREGGDLLGAEIGAAATIGLRFHPTRGSMDLSEKDGGLPPDSVVQGIDEILTACTDAVARWHDPSPESMLRIALAPCSPFSVTTDLLRESATLARELGVRMHTHLAESPDENTYCDQHFGCTPLQYMESVGWVGDDVWFAHGIEFADDEIARLAATSTGVAHCPTSNARLGNRICRTRELVDAGVPVGLGVDGAASNESARLLEEAHQAVLMARARGGPTALTTRTAIELATLGGARVLGRDKEIGSIEVGKLADLVLWDISGLAHAGIDDPVAALVLGAIPPIRGTWVGGRRIVTDNDLVTADLDAVAADCAAEHRRLLDKAG
ncbi:8-oxoguanine deaminase [Gordonia polyisoprenivorans]|uniref:8-oxoguanine deaminase n=1 Tax=Gordonia polyisoprenivorans TaxID=84595 RepID=UPI001AD7CFCE|nr:8-oxoguanine deaminase [Gordonia polyisoprenivorans]QTI71217.1 8-oxoguanine deaminase [Gordonia polyisoprenivorans]